MNTLHQVLITRIKRGACLLAGLLCSTSLLTANGEEEALPTGKEANAASLERGREVTEATKRLLSETIIPHVKLENATLEDAVTSLKKSLASAKINHPAANGPNFTTMKGKNFVAKPITLELKDATAATVIGKVAEQAGMTATVQLGLVTFWPKTAKAEEASLGLLFSQGRGILDTGFSWISATTIRASLLALAILTIQALLWRWLPAPWRHALWLPVLLVLALPVLPAVPFSIFPRPEAKEIQVIETSTAIAEQPGKSALPTQAPAPVSEPAVPWRDVLAITWLLGAAIVLGTGIAGYRRSMRLVTKNAGLPDEPLRSAIERATRETGLAHSPKTIVSPAVESPAVTGLFRPVLLLPSRFPEGFTSAESRLILLHELTHLKRKDLVVNWLICVLQALHWFNPILWFAFARLRADREAACDAQVLSLDATDARSDYGTALLKLQCVAPARSLSLGFVGIFERNHELKSRIMEISSHRRNHPAWKAGGAVLIAVVTLFGATKAQEEAPKPRAAEPKVIVDGIDPNSGKAHIQRKLDAIILPVVAMENASVEEAIDFIRLRSVQLDTNEADPAKKGVNFVIRKPRRGGANEEDPGSLRVTLSLKNVTLRKIFEEICAQTDLKYKVDDFAVTFVPASEPDDAPVVPQPPPPKLEGKAVDANSKIIIPVVDFEDVSLKDAVKFLNTSGQELAKGAPVFPVVLDPKVNAEIRIKELRLRNVPLAVAVKYIAEASRTSITANDTEMRLNKRP